MGEGGRTLHEGERLRALLLRAALREPDPLLVDRPDAAADPDALALIGRIARETGATALVALPREAATPAWAHRRLDAEARALPDRPEAGRIARGASAPIAEGLASSS